MRVLAASSYVTTFPADSALSERVLFPAGPHETHGMEDARFVRFTDDDGSVTYYATYTAFDGFEIVPQLIQTDDFVTLPDRARSTAPAAQNKGMALFPRRIGGQVRHAVAPRSREPAPGDVRRRPAAGPTSPSCIGRSAPWELLQIGNCGSPIETAGRLAGAHPRRRPDAPVRARRPAARPRRSPARDRPAARAAARARRRASAKATCRTSSTPAARWSTADDLVLPYGLSDAGRRRRHHLAAGAARGAAKLRAVVTSASATS